MRPPCLVAMRSDNCMEFWDLTINTLKPVRVVDTAGDIIDDSFGLLTPIYCRKNTVAFTGQSYLQILFTSFNSFRSYSPSKFRNCFFFVFRFFWIDEYLPPSRFVDDVQSE